MGLNYDKEKELSFEMQIGAKKTQNILFNQQQKRSINFVNILVFML